jgi:hypothetical protein
MPDRNDLNAVLAGLLEAGESELLQELGTRAQAATFDPAAAGSYAPATAQLATMMGPLDEVRRFGARLFRRLNREAWKLVCGNDPDDAGDRDKLLAALGVDRTAAAAALTAILIANLGLSVAVAPVLAVLVIKRVFNPAYQEFCGAWKDSLTGG